MTRHLPRVSNQRTRLVLLTAVIVLSACGKAGSQFESTDSGIEGTVLVGPTCPVVQEESPCPDRPARAEISVTKSQGGSAGVVAVTSSGDDGKFRTTVAPGRYVVSVNASRAMSCKPVEVTIRAHEFTKITINCDSGIR